MDAPICKLCGHRHWGNDHRWADSAPVKLKKPPKATEDATAAEANPGSLVQGDALVEGMTQWDAPAADAPKKFDRAAYQREYMRKRRAKAREARAATTKTT